VSNQQQSELDVDGNGSCYYIVTTNEDQSLNDIHQFLLPEKIQNDYSAIKHSQEKIQSTMIRMPFLIVNLPLIMCGSKLSNIGLKQSKLSN
jgi:hypothetical protein